MSKRSVLIFVAVLFLGCENSEEISGVAALNTKLQELNCKRLDQFVASVNLQTDFGIFEGDTAPDTTGNPANASPSSPTAAEEAAATNETSVKEADFVKTEGAFIYVLKDDIEEQGQSRLHSYRVSAEGHLQQLSSLKISGYPSEFLLNGSNAVVIGTGLVENATSRGVILHHIRVQEGQLRLKKTFFIEGNSYVTSRFVGKNAQIVVKKNLLMHTLFRPNATSLNQKDFLSDYWSFKSQESGHEKEGELNSCGSVFIPDDILNASLSPFASYRWVVSLVSLPLDVEEAHPRALSVVIGDFLPVISVNERSLYVGSNSWMGHESEIFKFSFNENGTLAYEASGKVPGNLTTVFGGYNSQFAMDEYENVLRVGTTLNQGSVIESSLFTLRQEGNNLKMIGALRDLHPGEPIYGIRFSEERGYVVTFRRVDPLFVIDLSRPEHPTVTGELEVPGFSTFLAPVDENTLLTIGREGGVKLSLFDVADPNKPQLIDSTIIGEEGANSEALTDHRAFQFFADRGLLAIPVNFVMDPTPDQEVWWSSVYPNEEQIWSVHRETGFSFRGSIQHSDLVENSEEDCLFFPPASMRRAFEVSGNLITVSSAGLKTHSFEDFETAISSEKFPALAFDFPYGCPVGVIFENDAL